VRIAVSSYTKVSGKVFPVFPVFLNAVTCGNAPKARNIEGNTGNTFWP